MTRRGLGLAVLGIIALVAVLAYARRAELSMQLVERMAERRLAGDPLADLGDGLHVGLCGAGSPLQDAERSGPCTLVIAGRRQFLFDAGASASRNLVRMGFNPGDLEALFLTHFHSDHIDGLGEVMLQRWAGGSRSEPLPVYGPAGVDDVLAGFTQAYTPDKAYRVASRRRTRRTRPTASRTMGRRSSRRPVSGGQRAHSCRMNPPGASCSSRNRTSRSSRSQWITNRCIRPWVTGSATRTARSS